MEWDISHEMVEGKQKKRKRKTTTKLYMSKNTVGKCLDEHNEIRLPTPDIALETFYLNLKLSSMHVFSMSTHLAVYTYALD